jgi:hypothetical protein
LWADFLGIVIRKIFAKKRNKELSDMTKMTYDEWKVYEEERRKQYKEMGVTDINEERAKRMWDDPLVKAEDIPATRFVFDTSLGQFVFAGVVNEVKN